MEMEVEDYVDRSARRRFVSPGMTSYERLARPYARGRHPHKTIHPKQQTIPLNNHNSIHDISTQTEVNTEIQDSNSNNINNPSVSPNQNSIVSESSPLTTSMNNPNDENEGNNGNNTMERPSQLPLPLNTMHLSPGIYHRSSFFASAPAMGPSISSPAKASGLSDAINNIIYSTGPPPKSKRSTSEDSRPTLIVESRKGEFWATTLHGDIQYIGDEESMPQSNVSRLSLLNNNDHGRHKRWLRLLHLHDHDHAKKIKKQSKSKLKLRSSSYNDPSQHSMEENNWKRPKGRWRSGSHDEIPSSTFSHKINFHSEPEDNRDCEVEDDDEFHAPRPDDCISSGSYLTSQPRLKKQASSTVWLESDGEDQNGSNRNLSFAESYLKRPELRKQNSSTVWIEPQDEENMQIQEEDYAEGLNEKEHVIKPADDVDSGYVEDDEDEELESLTSFKNVRDVDFIRSNSSSQSGKKESVNTDVDSSMDEMERCTIGKSPKGKVPRYSVGEGPSNTLGRRSSSNVMLLEGFQGRNRRLSLDPFASKSRHRNVRKSIVRHKEHKDAHSPSSEFTRRLREARERIPKEFRDEAVMGTSVRRKIRKTRSGVRSRRVRFNLKDETREFEVESAYSGDSNEEDHSSDETEDSA